MFSMLSCTHTWLSPVKEVWMVATLPQLHEDIEHSHLMRLACPVHDINVFH